MKVTTKGQVTIPLEIREEFGIHAGTDVEFLIKDETITLNRKDAPASTIRQTLNRMRGKGTGKLTTDQILALTRGDE